MPTAALRYCATPRCATKVQRGHCPAHTQAQQHQRYVTQGSQRARGYTRTWEAAAKAFKQEFPLCGDRPQGQVPVMSECREEGRVTLAYVVDHVTPHQGDELRFWDRDGNWQSLCLACHARKTSVGL